MNNKKQIWVNCETKENLIKIAKKENVTITKLMENFSKRGLKKYE